jgi:hypothetical protein
MNNIIKVLLGLLFVFIIILCILKQPLNKCHSHHYKEGIDNAVDDNSEPFEKQITNIENILNSFKTTIAKQSSSDMLITLLNNMKIDISSMKNDIAGIKSKIK